VDDYFIFLCPKSNLQEYVVIEQDFVDIEVCRRKKHWQSEHYYLGDEIYFESIDCHLPVLEIYDRVVNADIESYFEQLEKQEKIKSSEG